MRWIRMLGLAVLAACASGEPLAARPPRSAAARLGVDLVSIRGGARLRGAVVRRDADGALVMAVTRDWLKTAHPELLAAQEAQEATERKAALTVLRDRIQTWLEERKDQQRLAFFLKQELERVESELERFDEQPALPTQFVLLSIPAADVVRVLVQPAKRKQVALLAWRERLPDVETSSVEDLERALAERNVDVTADVVDLSDRLPPQPQDEREWAARQAICEYHYIEAIDFQGTGGLLVRSGQPQGRGDMAKLLPKLLQAPLAGGLGDLLEPSGKPKGKEQPFEAATRAADQEGLRGVRVTRVKQNLAARRVWVETRFLARMPDGEWETAWVHTETMDASQPRPDLEKRIAADPQIRGALELMQSLGLAAGNEPIELAVRFGAAVMQAQQAADGRFFQFRDRCLRRLDAPPWQWPEH